MSEDLQTFLKTSLVLCIAICTPIQANAGFFKWMRNEALPTISGARPIVIKPYISISSGSTKIRFGNDSVLVKVGDVTVQTNHLRYRLAQAACVYATGGDVMTCAPDVIDREAHKVFDQVANGVEVNSDLPPPKPVAFAGGAKPSTSSGGLKIDDTLLTVIAWDPPPVSVGFNFDQNSPSSANPSPSSFFHSFSVARGVDDKNQATVLVVGRIDFANLQGHNGGILCLFASEKGKFLRSRNGEYQDKYGLVALGSSVILPSSPWLEKMQIQLILPWSELELPDDVDPYAPKFVQCSVTVDNQLTQALDWAPF
ncbi:MAG: hypothetical protein Q7K26_00500 [bacterium]|nr:hypothetical protein [bacterium]